MKAKFLIPVLSVLMCTSFADAYSSLVKVRAGYLENKATIKQKGTSDSAENSAKDSIKNGMIGEVALSMFFNKNIAAELSAGYGKFDIHGSASAKRNSSIVPLTAALQFYLPVKDTFYPYVGVGYSYRLILEEPTGIKINNAGGVILQAGMDIIPEQSWVGLNLDFKYSPSIKYTLSKPANSQSTYDLKIKGFTAMAGITIPL